MEFELVDDGAYPNGDGLEVWRLGPVLLLWVMVKVVGVGQ